MKYKIGDYVLIQTGLYADTTQIAEIIDMEEIAEIDAIDYFVRINDENILGPYKDWCFTKLISPNEILKQIL